MNELTILWEKYGWAGFILYVLLKEILPMYRDKILPAKISREKKKTERLSKADERSMIAEDRQNMAIEAMTKALHQMTLAITANNERLNQLIAGSLIHNQETTELIHRREKRKQ